MNLFISIQTLHGFTWSWWLLCWLSFLSSDYLSLLVHHRYSLSIWEFNFHPYCYTYTSHPPYAPAWLLPQLQPERLILNPPSYLHCVTECPYWPRQILPERIGHINNFSGNFSSSKTYYYLLSPHLSLLESPCLFQCSSSQIFSDPSFSWLKPCYYPLSFTSESPHSGPFTAQLSLPAYPPLSKFYWFRQGLGLGSSSFPCNLLLICQSVIWTKLRVAAINKSSSISDSCNFNETISRELSH